MTPIVDRFCGCKLECEFHTIINAHFHSGKFSAEKTLCKMRLVDTNFPSEYNFEVNSDVFGKFSVRGKFFSSVLNTKETTGSSFRAKEICQLNVLVKNCRKNPPKLVQNDLSRKT
jgi:hypothetical protein